MSLFDPARPWDERLCVTEEFVRDVRPEYLTVGEGVVEFHTKNETGLYEVEAIVDGIWKLRFLGVVA